MQVQAWLHLHASRCVMLIGMPQLAVRLTDDEMAALDAAVREGRAESRADAVRRGIALLRAELRELEIAASYARAYSGQPAADDRWLDAAGRSALADA